MLGKNIAEIEEGLLFIIGGIERMIKLLPTCIVRCECAEMDQCEALAVEIQRQAKVVTRSLVASNPGGDFVHMLIRFPLRLERIADELASIPTCCRMAALDSVEFDDAARGALNAIFAINLDMIANFREVVVAPNNSGAQHILVQAELASQTLQDARLDHWARLGSGECSPEAGALFLDILDSLKSVNEYLQKMADNLLRLGAVANGAENRRNRSGE
jgi:Na+/phosphate symporter